MSALNVQLGSAKTIEINVECTFQEENASKNLKGSEEDYKDEENNTSENQKSLYR